jgi:pyruvate,water dikinase
MIHYKLLGKITENTYGHKSVGIRNTLIQAIPGLISSAPLKQTWDIVQQIDRTDGGRAFFLNNSSAEVYQQIQEGQKWEGVLQMVNKYFEKWGFRCSGELMFFNENYIEKPEKFIELIQGYMRHETQDPGEVIFKKDIERRKAMRNFSNKIFRKYHILLPISIFKVGQLYLIAKLCKQAISSRERVRYKQAEMYYKFKVVMKNIGKKATKEGWLNEEMDVFYLSYKESGELISSSHMFPAELKEIVTNRKEAFADKSNKSFPQSFTTDFGYRPESVHPEIDLIEGAREFYGLAASGGRIKSKVKVLESVLEGNKLEKGDILVTRQTDPGWAMVFPIIGGLIVERGGALSHGAIVAREFGIPAVIGIENITRILKDNDEVIVDGDLGKIQLL